MSRWWRAYDEAVDDPKLLLLSDRAHRNWFNLLCVASAYGGILPPINIVAVKLRMTPARAAAVITELKVAGLFDENETGFHPHNWGSRQFKSDVSTERVKRFRNAKRNVSETSPETETETETETEKERKKEKEPSLRSGCAFGQFWDAYPNKVGKKDAERKFSTALRSTSLPELMAGLERYIHKTDDRPWCNPATWLHQQRWNDQPATGPPRVNGHPLPRPGSREDQRERTANAYAKLSEFVDAHANDTGGRSEAGEAPVRLLPIAKPARS